MRGAHGTGAVHMPHTPLGGAVCVHVFLHSARVCTFGNVHGKRSVYKGLATGCGRCTYNHVQNT
jgi:hypothetical protein